jgi:hypothetical protein
MKLYPLPILLNTLLYWGRGVKLASNAEILLAVKLLGQPLPREGGKLGESALHEGH